MKFWARVEKTETCWLWTGGRTGRYGKFCLTRTSWCRAHRWAWEEANGPIPEGIFVCHHCDTPLCVRVDHLFLGDNAANVADRVAKNRTRTWATERTRLGSAHPRAKVTEAQVLAARLACRNGERSMISYSREWGVAFATARAAIVGETWRHI